MQLLVSVASADEASAALLGGADYIDAKNPVAGPLGPVSTEVFSAIRDRVPASVPMSAALGDVATESQVEAAFELISEPVAFVKLGFAGLGDRERIAALLIQALELTSRLPGHPILVPVAYADAAVSGGIEMAELPALVQRFGLRGALLDTVGKDGRGLFDLVRPSRLRAIVARVGAAGGFLAIAGSLGLDDMATASGTGARIFGVRGAACVGGRTGPVSNDRVSALAARLRFYSAEPPSMSFSRVSSWSASPIPTHHHWIPSGSARVK